MRTFGKSFPRRVEGIQCNAIYRSHKVINSHLSGFNKNHICSTRQSLARGLPLSSAPWKIPKGGPRHQFLILRYGLDMKYTSGNVKPWVSLLLMSQGRLRI